MLTQEAQKTTLLGPGEAGEHAQHDFRSGQSRPQKAPRPWQKFCPHFQYNGASLKGTNRKAT